MFALGVKCYDISVLLGQESIDYPGDTPFQHNVVAALDHGDGCMLSEMTMSAHAGTHLDAPAHFIAGGKTLDDYGASDFILPAQVIDVTGKAQVRRSDLIDLTVAPGTALLFKTDNSQSGRAISGVFSPDYITITADAAKWCVEQKLALVGIDYITIDAADDESFTVHKTLLGNDILILEGLNLKAVPSGRYTLICLPLKLKGIEASPVRAILLPNCRAERQYLL